MPKPKRKTKSCLGCDNPFITYRNYDYCQSCSINNNRYVQNHCSECGDDSGIVKFKNQKSRPCKLCYLKKPMTWNDKNKNKNSFETNESQFWNEVEENSKNLIANLIEKTLPISTVPKTFDLEKDPDYRVLLRDDFPNYYSDSEEYQEKITNQNWNEEDVNYVAQELICHYFDIVVKNLTEWLSQYNGFESTKLAENYDNQ